VCWLVWQLGRWFLSATQQCGPLVEQVQHCWLASGVQLLLGV
jgi:hypothetical protein